MIVTEREAQAIHEAGHAVVGHFMGFRVRAIQWVASGAGISFEETSDSPNREEMCAALIVQVAGYVAMRKAGVLDRPLASEYLRDSAGNLALGSDPMVASVHVGRILASQGVAPPANAAEDLARTIACLQAAEQGALALLNQHWAAVEVVATALLASERLFGDDVHRIIDDPGAALPVRR